MERNGLAASASKLLLFQTKIRFLGHHIYQGTIKPIQRALIFAEKFPDEIKDRRQLQRFLGCLNYVADFFPICVKLVHLYTIDYEQIPNHGLHSIHKLSNRSNNM